MSELDDTDASQQSPFEDHVIIRGAYFDQLAPPRWPAADNARCVYASGAVRITVHFTGSAKSMRWRAECGVITGRTASSPGLALASADAVALRELQRLGESMARAVAAQEALQHPSDAKCDTCSGEVVDRESTGVICRACFDAGPGACVECGAPTHGLVCSPRCARAADLWWDDAQKVPA